MEFNPIPPYRWGRDHWSLLAFVVSQFDGVLDRRRLRCNPSRHPLVVGERVPQWQDSYSTRLNSARPDESDECTLTGHDDWDCLEDIEAAGMLEIVSPINGIVRLTPKGNAVGYKLREHKRRGGSFATFTMPNDLTYEDDPVAVGQMQSISI